MFGLWWYLGACFCYVSVSFSSFCFGRNWSPCPWTCENLLLPVLFLFLSLCPCLFLYSMDVEGGSELLSCAELSCVVVRAFVLQVWRLLFLFLFLFLFFVLQRSVATTSHCCYHWLILPFPFPFPSSSPLLVYVAPRGWLVLFCHAVLYPYTFILLYSCITDSQPFLWRVYSLPFPSKASFGCVCVM